MDSLEELAPPAGKFVESYEGSSKAFPRGKSFLDAFHDDQYASDRQNNLYFPFASQEEWQFTSWLLCSRLSLTTIDSLLALDIMSQPVFCFCPLSQQYSAPGDPYLFSHWEAAALSCRPEAPTKHPVHWHLFYCQLLECLQALLSNPVLAPYISFIPRKVWTSAVRICCIYDEWLTGEQAWDAQDALPPSATILDVVLSSDKRNISIMTGNCMAHPILISLANINVEVHSKMSLHGYLLLALLPILKFFEKTTHVHGLLQDQLFHQALNQLLTPLKTAAAVEIMMSDLVGNLHYCYMLLASWIHQEKLTVPLFTLYCSTYITIFHYLSLKIP
ncbi:hypothetical protein EDC04DRAFT_2586190 [Pisolithus marmoratus]|nr:hypothetical protein EDC04DRAFT_2586190 [Pisolithus marmoratus]